MRSTAHSLYGVACHVRLSFVEVQVAEDQNTKSCQSSDKEVSPAGSAELNAGRSADSKKQSGEEGENEPPKPQSQLDREHIQQGAQPWPRSAGPEDNKLHPEHKPQQDNKSQQDDKPRQDDKLQPASSARAPDPRQNASKQHSLAGWIIFCLLVIGTAIMASLALARASYHPRTDDAEVFANFIGMAPQVEGPITELSIHDNDYVKAGQLLFVVDERPYRYALERALSQQASLEGQIEDRERSIRSQISGVRAANATVLSSASNRDAMAADISQAQADVSNAKAAVRRDEADRQYAADNLHRLEPLLAQQYVTVDQVDQARTLLEVRSRTVQQAESQVALAEARMNSNSAHFDQSDADVEQRRAQREQAVNGVQTLAPLVNQREERAAEVRSARYNLNNCKIYAPFDGYVTNLTTSLGAYVHPGTQVFTMIDTRTWWTIANFRETQLTHVILGSPADVFLLSRETQPLHGTVESIGYGVAPDPSVAGAITPGLPAVQRTLSWVHLAARYPVRIRIDSPPAYLRIGQSAVAVVYGRYSPIPSEATRH